MPSLAGLASRLTAWVTLKKAWFEFSGGSKLSLVSGLIARLMKMAAMGLEPPAAGLARRRLGEGGDAKNNSVRAILLCALLP